LAGLILLRPHQVAALRDPDMVPDGVVLRPAQSLGTRFVTNQENSTVDFVPWSLSPRPIRNSPPIRSTKDRTILIPSPLQAAGSNPSGKTGPSLETDSA